MSRSSYTPAARWADALVDFEAAQNANGYNVQTVRKRCDHIARLSLSVDVSPWEMTYAGLIAWVSNLPYARSTRLDYRMSIRSFYRWAHRVGRVFVDPSEEPSRRASALPVPDAWASEINAFRTFLRSSGKPETTVKQYSNMLRRFARDHASVAPFDMSLDDLVEWMGNKRWKPETKRNHRTALREFYKWAKSTKRSRVNPAKRMPIAKPGEIKPRPADEEAYAAALRNAKPREALILRLAGELGMRRSEIILVHTRDVQNHITIAPDGRSVILYSLLVHGKGNKDRLLPLPHGLAIELLRRPAGFVFPGNLDGHLSAATIGKSISNLLPPGVALHALRHRFATRAYDVDHDVFTVQQLLGHSSPETTRRYVKTSDASLRRLVDAISA